jgi:hypothetical protein
VRPSGRGIRHCVDARITRSLVLARSNSANSPSIWNIARAAGVEVSNPRLVQVEADFLAVQFSQETNNDQIGNSGWSPPMLRRFVAES